MATKREYIKWGKIFTYIGAILYIVGGVIALLSLIIPAHTMGPLENDLIIQGAYIIHGLYLWLIALITIVIGSIAIVLTNTKLNELALGIILVIFAIIALGIPGIFMIIGGILFIIASTKKR